MLFAQKEIIWIVLLISYSLSFPTIRMQPFRNFKLNSINPNQFELFWHWRSNLGSETISQNWKPSKINEKSFLFHVKSSLFWLFGYVEKWLHKKAKVNFRIYDFTDWTINNNYTPIAQYPSKGNQVMKFGKLKKYNVRNIFLPKSCRKWDREAD